MGNSMNQPIAVWFQFDPCPSWQKRGGSWVTQTMHLGLGREQQNCTEGQVPGFLINMCAYIKTDDSFISPVWYWNDSSRQCWRAVGPQASNVVQSNIMDCEFHGWMFCTAVDRVGRQWHRSAEALGRCIFSNSRCWLAIPLLHSVAILIIGYCIPIGPINRVEIKQKMTLN